MGRPRSEAFDEIRQDILDRAAGLFARNGYTRTSMDGVAKLCGVTKPTLYHYYRDKDDLLLSIVNQHLSRLLQVVEQVEAEALDGPGRLHRLVQRFLEEYADARDKHRVLTEDVKFLPPQDRADVVRLERSVVAAFVEAICDIRPDLKPHELATPVAMLLFGMINWLFTWWDPRGRLGPDELARLIDQLLFRGLSGLLPEDIVPTAAWTEPQVADLTGR